MQCKVKQKMFLNIFLYLLQKIIWTFGPAIFENNQPDAIFTGGKSHSVGRIANQRKVPKWLPFENYKSEPLNMLCAHMGGGGHVGISIPRMKLLCLNMWLGKVCTDDANDTNDDNGDDARWVKQNCIRLFG